MLVGCPAAGPQPASDQHRNPAPAVRPDAPGRIPVESLPFAGSADETRTPPPLSFPSSPGDKPAPLPSSLPRFQKAPAFLTGTANLPGLPIGLALPFAKSTGDRPLPQPPSSDAGESKPAPTTLPRVHKAPAHLTGTTNLPSLPIGFALPFAKSTGDHPPVLTLEEYAALRANLTVKGEEDAETWKRFGISSRAMKEALQVYFAAKFRDSPETRDRFFELLQRMLTELRGKPPGA